jgi:hypothetical protein
MVYVNPRNMLPDEVHRLFAREGLSDPHHQLIFLGHVLLQEQAIKSRIFEDDA